jgi:hypothetical protein
MARRGYDSTTLLAPKTQGQASLRIAGHDSYGQALRLDSSLKGRAGEPEVRHTKTDLDASWNVAERPSHTRPVQLYPTALEIATWNLEPNRGDFRSLTGGQEGIGALTSAAKLVRLAHRSAKA